MAQHSTSSHQHSTRTHHQSSGRIGSEGCRCHLHLRLRAAAAWLDTPCNSEWISPQAVILACCAMAFVREATPAEHSRCVYYSERLLEAAFVAASHRHCRLPLPLPSPHEAAAAVCRCARLSDMAVQEVWLSGSVREGCDVRLVECLQTSDLDVMLLLGPVVVTMERQTAKKSAAEKKSMKSGAGEQTAPAIKVSSNSTKSATEAVTSPNGTSNKQTPLFRWQKTSLEQHHQSDFSSVNTATFSPPSRPASPHSTAPPTLPDAGVMELTATSTAQPGFLLLHHKRQPDCRHQGRQPFSAELVRQMMSVFGASVSDGRLNRAGPAATGKLKSLYNTFDSRHPGRGGGASKKDGVAIDVVGCVRLLDWPSETFARRPRPSGLPDDAMVQWLCAKSVLLVPVGFPISPNEQEEWRLSFSQHEYAVLRTAMTADQRRCLTVLKYCKTLLSAPVKSYYLKTALLWMWESADASAWQPEKMHTTLLQLLQHIDDCVKRGVMKCYFMPEINILATRSRVELDIVSIALKKMQQRLLPSLLAMVADWNDETPVQAANRLMSKAPEEGEVTPLPTKTRLTLPLVHNDFDTLLSNMLAPAGDISVSQSINMPVWTLLTSLFYVVLQTWLGPILAAEAARQQHVHGHGRRRSGCRHGLAASTSMPEGIPSSLVGISSSLNTVQQAEDDPHCQNDHPSQTIRPSRAPLARATSECATAPGALTGAVQVSRSSLRLPDPTILCFESKLLMAQHIGSAMGVTLPDSWLYLDHRHDGGDPDAKLTGCRSLNY